MDAVLKLMSVLTNDYRFEEILELMKEIGKNNLAKQ